MSDSGSWIRPLRRLALYIRGHFVCAYCLRDLTGVKPDQITLDHVRGSGNGHRGADHSNRNLVVCCNKCNAAKQDKPFETWATPEQKHRVRNQLRRKVNTELARSIMSERQSERAAA